MKLQIFPANFEACDVTDPELVRAFRCEVAFKDIPLFLSLSLDSLFLRVRSYAVQVKPAHKIGYALSEILICGECGSPYHRQTYMPKGEKIYVWRCLNRLENGKRML